MCTRKTPRRPIASRIAAAALKLLISSLCASANGVEVDINASSNIALLSGQLIGVTVKADSLVYNGVSISGGAALYTDEIQLKSTDRKLWRATTPRLAKPFSVSVCATITESDLNRMGPLRDALEVLLRQITTTALSGAVGRALPSDIGGVTWHLESVRLLEMSPETEPVLPFWPFNRRRRRSPTDEGCMELNARATLSSGRTVMFSVCTGVEPVDDGQIVRLKDPHLLWNGMSFPLVTIDTIGIQLDPSSRLTRVYIRNNALTADGITIVSPPVDATRQLESSNRQ